MGEGDASGGGGGDSDGGGGDSGGDSDGGGSDIDAGGSDIDAGTPDAAPEPGVAPEIDGQIVINEVMAANALTLIDEGGNASDWIELYNPTEVDIPLYGYGLTNDLTQPTLTRLPEGVVLAAGGYLVIHMDAGATAAPTHVALLLEKSAGVVALARPDGSFIDRVSWGAQEVDFSAAREPDGSDEWAIEWHPSPAAANPSGDGEPVGLEDVSRPPEAIPATGDLSEQILGYDALPELALTVSPTNVAKLLADPRVDVPATITFRGRSYGPIGVHLKGGGSFMPFDQKPSFRIKIDEYVEAARFYGKKDLTFNNIHDDPSMMHERLGYFVARAAGLPASRSTHMRLTVNGQFYGLYNNTETVKPAMLARYFADSSGPLFEQTDLDYVPSAVPSFELDGGPDDRSKLVGLTNALAGSGTPAQVMSAVGQFLDVPHFLRYWGMGAVIGQFDSMPYSNPGDDVYLYADPTSGRLKIVPWGMDETFFSSSFPPTQIHSILAKTCMASPACEQAWVDQAWDVLALIEDLDLEAERLRVKAQIAPFVAADTRKPYTAEQVATSQNALGFFIRERRIKLQGHLPPPSSSP